MRRYFNSLEKFVASLVSITAIIDDKLSLHLPRIFTCDGPASKKFSGTVMALSVNPFKSSGHDDMKLLTDSVGSPKMISSYFDHLMFKRNSMDRAQFMKWLRNDLMTMW